MFQMKNSQAAQSELESWAGMRFRLYNYQQDKKVIELFKEKSIQILPINL